MASFHTTACSIRLVLMGGRFAFGYRRSLCSLVLRVLAGMDAGEMARLYYLEGVSAKTPLPADGAASV